MHVIFLTVALCSFSSNFNDPCGGGCQGRNIVAQFWRPQPRRGATIIIGYCSILFKWYAMDDNIAMLDTKVRSLRQGSCSPPDFVQQLWSWTLICGSIFDEKEWKIVLGGCSSSDLKDAELLVGRTLISIARRPFSKSRNANRPSSIWHTAGTCFRT